MDLARLSLNTKTVPTLTLAEVIEHCQRRGIRTVAPWRDTIAPMGAAKAGGMLADAGLGLSSLCRGGMFTAASAAGRQAAVEDNLRAIDDAAALGAPVLVLVCGPVVDRDPRASAGMVEDGIAAVLHHAQDCGVRLGIEPLHPMLAADRSVITRVADATRVVDRLAAPPSLGVVVDAYHVWWDLELDESLGAVGGGGVLGFHVSDWASPLTGGLASGRAMMGDGSIDLPALAARVEKSRYAGPVEVEVLSDLWWRMPPDHVLDTVVERFVAHV
ncbi:MAG TPA: sugar phosphate isomerase/epimerase family protein [Intrasporangium sp.]|uniref:sugar phosphate isomerase/epimerase family protein n=1 Tax=Intrasporangium sp. TaxID=1925024 RepID=UPI002D78AC59|nr:sugar phosphate isomerase/epimerase family protein [Intrasporangium sp.]HET7398250.1 sugar phosphate isomerase/epimerase family protein [Intrasporangium sp.]